jgi:hypothetical protein
MFVKVPREQLIELRFALPKGSVDILKWICASQLAMVPVSVD